MLPPSANNAPPAPSGAATSIITPTLLTQGAEALLYKTAFLHPSIPAALKLRPPKPYRHPTLDRRLTRARILHEARCLAKLARDLDRGVARVPGLYAVDWEGNVNGNANENGREKGIDFGVPVAGAWMLMEWVSGPTVRAAVDAWEHWVRRREGRRRQRQQQRRQMVDREMTGDSGKADAQVQDRADSSASASASAVVGVGAEAGTETDQADRQEEAEESEAEAAVRAMLRRVGRAVGALHAAGVVHGDLTSSNLIVTHEEDGAGAKQGRGEAKEERGPNDDADTDVPKTSHYIPPFTPAITVGPVTLLDFGLATQSSQDEDRAVDLYVLERAFGSSHPRAERLFAVEVLGPKGYAGSFWGAGPALKRLEAVRLRGRKRSMLG